MDLGENDGTVVLFRWHPELVVETREPFLDGEHHGIEIDSFAVVGDGMHQLLAGDTGQLAELIGAENRDQFRDVSVAHFVQLSDLVSPDAESVERHERTETFEQVVEIDALAVTEDVDADCNSVDAGERSVLGHLFDDLLHRHVQSDPLSRCPLWWCRNPALTDCVLLKVIAGDRNEFFDLDHEKLPWPVVVETGESLA